VLAVDPGYPLSGGFTSLYVLVQDVSISKGISHQFSAGYIPRLIGVERRQVNAIESVRGFPPFEEYGIAANKYIEGSQPATIAPMSPNLDRSDWLTLVPDGE
jgi:hypothetical protein